MKKLPVTAVLIIAILSVTTLAHRALAVPNSTAATRQSSAASKWHVHTTQSFRVFATSNIQARQVAAACECLRGSLTEKWLTQKADEPWQPCCDIVVHPSQPSFIGAVGRGPGQTNGCSTIRVDKGRILARRIDLRCDICDPLTAALPHELTHVVLADRFLDEPLPRWADEGIALLADSPAKQDLHEKDLWTAFSTGSRIPLASLVRMSEYPTGHVAAFYAQSSSVVRLLVERSTEATFLDFVEYAMKHGYDVALQNTYGLRNIDALEQLWKREVLHRTAKRNEITPARNNRVTMAR